MTQKITTRKYNPNDARALAEIYYHTIHKVNVRDYSEKQVNAWAPSSSLEPDGLEDWKKKWAKVVPIVALQGENVVGFTEFETSGHIDCFFVHHAFQGVGVGTILMDAIEQEAKEKNIHLVYAQVSITAKPFFSKKGFKIVKQKVDVIRGCELICYVMQKHFL